MGNHGLLHVQYSNNKNLHKIDFKKAVSNIFSQPNSVFFSKWKIKSMIKKVNVTCVFFDWLFHDQNVHIPVRGSAEIDLTIKRLCMVSLN